MLHLAAESLCRFPGFKPLLFKVALYRYGAATGKGIVKVEKKIWPHVLMRLPAPEGVSTVGAVPVESSCDP